MTAPVIEVMRKRHVKHVTPIEEAVHRKPWSASVFNSEIELAKKGERYYIVLSVMGEIVGYAGLMFAVDEAHVTNIAVDPNHRRHGYARLLMCALAYEAIRAGSEALTLEVRVSNTAAQNLYREFGFAPAGVRQRYYENTEDAIVMWAHDIRSPEYLERLERIVTRVESGGESCAV